ncbi:unnamed protein product, partial [marine sediment metagenome]
EEELPFWYALVKKIMEASLQGIGPLSGVSFPTESKVGYNWGEMSAYP